MLKEKEVVEPGWGQGPDDTTKPRPSVSVDGIVEHLVPLARDLVRILWHDDDHCEVIKGNRFWLAAQVKMLRARAEKEFSPLTAEECERDALRFGHIAKRLEEVWSGNRRNRTQLLVRLRVAVRTHLDLLRRFGQTESFYLHELGPYHLRRIAADAPPGTFAVDAVGVKRKRDDACDGSCACEECAVAQRYKRMKKEGVRAVRTRERSERRRAREKRRSEEEQRESVGGGVSHGRATSPRGPARRPPRGGSGAATRAVQGGQGATA